MFEYDIRNPRVHVPLSLTDTCQLFLSITERGQKDHIEYSAGIESLNIQAIVRLLSGVKPPVPRMTLVRPDLAHKRHSPGTD
jgi:hypothetical protein